MSATIASLALCPSCPIALEARSLVLSEAFWLRASYVLLPFLVTGLVVREVVGRLDRGVRDDPAQTD